MSFISEAPWAIEPCTRYVKKQDLPVETRCDVATVFWDLVLRPLYALSERRRSWQPRPATFQTHALSPSRSRPRWVSSSAQVSRSIVGNIFYHSAANALLHCTSGPLKITTAHGNQRMRQQDWQPKPSFSVPSIPFQKSTTVFNAQSFVF